MYKSVGKNGYLSNSTSISRPEEDMDSVNIARVESDGVAGLSLHVLVGEEVIGHLRRAGHLTGSLQSQNQQV